MNDAEWAAKEEAARKIRDSICWAKYPRLAEIFKHRPPKNLTWLELAELIREMRFETERER